MRRPAVLPPVATTLLRPLKLALVATLAVEMLAWRAAFALALLARRCPFGASRCGAGIRPFEAAEILAIATALPGPFAFGAISGITLGGSRLRALLRAILMAVTVSIMAWAPLVGTTTGAPHIDHLRLGRSRRDGGGVHLSLWRSSGRSIGDNSLGSYSLGSDGSIGLLWLHGFHCCAVSNLRCGLLGSRRFDDGGLCLRCFGRVCRRSILRHTRRGLSIHVCSRLNNFTRRNRFGCNRRSRFRNDGFDGCGIARRWHRVGSDRIG